MQSNPKGKYDTRARQIEFYRQVLDRLAIVPGVRAVAVPADPVNAAVPNEAPEIEKDTEPDGTLPLVDVTVAIRYTTSFEATVLRLLNSVTLVTGLEGAVTLPPFHPITSLYASTDPSPVH